MNKILQNKSIIITRSQNQSQEFFDKLNNLGAQVLIIPAIKIVPLINEYTASIFMKIKEYKWIIFTSTNSIDTFFNLLKTFKMRLRFCALVGSPTTRDKPAALTPGWRTVLKRLVALSE